MNSPPFVRSPYNYDLKEASEASAYTETMPSLTVQSQAEDADLNVMMKRFGVTGKMPENVRLPTYGDFTEVTDYRSAIEAARAAEDSFMQFPADIRAQFDNDPQLFLAFVDNPANIEQTKKWFPKENFDASVRTGGDTGSASAQGSSQGGGEPPSGGVPPGAAPGGAK